MTTYREKREAKAERLRDWAGKREDKSSQMHEHARGYTAQIPFGQPILIGHHSERGHRNAIEKGWNAMGRAVENDKKAAAMASRADEIERQAANAIYSDDPDAIERLTEKLAAMEARRDQMKATNAAYRKEHRAELKAMGGYDRHHAVPHQSYEITNLGGNISRARKRLTQLQREQEHGPRDRIITARRDGTCEICAAALSRGDQIRYNRQQGARCVECE